MGREVGVGVGDKVNVGVGRRVGMGVGVGVEVGRGPGVSAVGVAVAVGEGAVVGVLVGAATRVPPSSTAWKGTATGRADSAGPVSAMPVGVGVGSPPLQATSIASNSRAGMPSLLINGAGAATAGAS